MIDDPIRPDSGDEAGSPADGEGGSPADPTSTSGEEAYRVELDVYSGPLDLLLHLIKKEEIDIYDIPISKILDQFMAHLEVLRLMELDEVGDFLVLAANLMLIKARMLVPEPVDLNLAEDEIEDPRTELVQKLLDYKRYKEAALDLEGRRSQRNDRFDRGKDREDESGACEEESGALTVELWDLVEAFARIVREVTAGRTVVEFADDDRPIHEYMEEIVGRLSRRGSFHMESLFDGVDSRSQMISYFMAVLELMRKKQIFATQNTPFGPILIEAPEMGEAAPEFDEVEARDVHHETARTASGTGQDRRDTDGEDVG